MRFALVAAVLLFPTASALSFTVTGSLEAPTLYGEETEAGFWLYWDHVPEATSYHVYHNDTRIAVVVAPSHLVVDASTGDFHVTAVRGLQESDPSNTETWDRSTCVKTGPWTPPVSVSPSACIQAVKDALTPP